MDQLNRLVFLIMKYADAREAYEWQDTSGDDIHKFHEVSGIEESAWEELYDAAVAVKESVK